MRKTLALLFAMTLCLAGAPAYAVDCAASTGPYTLSPGVTYYEYTPESLEESTSYTYQCWTIESGMTHIASTSFWSVPGFEVQSTDTAISRQLVVPNDGYSGYWQAEVLVDFVDPTNNFYNEIDIHAFVYHPGTGTTTDNLVYQHSGSSGNDRGRVAGLNFSAAVGDTITFSIIGNRAGGSNVHIQFTDARLFHLSS